MSFPDFYLFGKENDYGDREESKLYEPTEGDELWCEWGSFGLEEYLLNSMPLSEERNVFGETAAAEEEEVKPGEVFK